MRIAYLTTLTEQGVGFIEQNHTINPLRLREDPIEILLRLADVFVHHGREVNRVKVETELGCQHLGGHRLTGSRRTREERRQSATSRRRSAHLPDVQDLLPI